MRYAISVWFTWLLRMIHFIFGFLGKVAHNFKTLTLSRTRKKNSQLTLSTTSHDHKHNSQSQPHLWSLNPSFHLRLIATLPYSQHRLSLRYISLFFIYCFPCFEMWVYHRSNQIKPKDLYINWFYFLGNKFDLSNSKPKLKKLNPN